MTGVCGLRQIMRALEIMADCGCEAGLASIQQVCENSLMAAILRL